MQPSARAKAAGAPVEADISKLEEGALLRVKGFIDSNTAPDIEKTIESILAKKQYRIAIDLKDVSFISSAGWGVFVSEIDQMRRGARHYVVARRGREILGYAGLWFTADEAHVTNVAVRTDWRRHGIATRLLVDGKILQDANTNQLAFGVRSIIANASAFYTLHPGDVIMAGTAASFAPIHPGSAMVAEFEGLGRMEVTVKAHEQ